MNTTDVSLAQVQDRFDLASRKYHYCRCADAKDVEGMLSVFTADCVAAFEPDDAAALHGRDALATFFRAALEPVVSSSHHVSNLDIVFDGPDRARMHSYLYSWQRLVGYPERADRHRWARYEDEFVRTTSGWRQTRLRMRVAGQITELASRVGEVVGVAVWPDGRPG